MPFTIDQQKAIDHKGHNIIVSAGAGSGKTAVLTTRIFEKVKAGTDLSRLLVLTFTKAAALEMRVRTKKSLTKAINNPNLDDKSLAYFTDALNKIDSCYITTFDSFALSMVKKYHYLLDVKKNISIVDDAVITLKKQEIIDEIFNEYYHLALENKAPLFSDLLKKFSRTSDDNIKDFVKELAGGLSKNFNRDQYINNYLEEHYNKKVYLDKLQKFNEACNLGLEEFRASITELYDLAVGTKYGDSLNTLLDYINSDHDYDDIKAFFSTFTFGRLPNGLNDDELKMKKERFKEMFDNYKKTYLFYESESKMIEALEDTKPYVKILLEIIQEFFKRLDQYKHEENLFEFDDISLMALNLVRSNLEVKKEISNSFDEILLDEYQDTSDIQEAFMQEIAHNNLYMVGDMKQSIYLFRNANPKIFKEKYDTYEVYKNDKEEFKVGEKIDLKENFRSRSEVLNNINLIFKNLMTNDYGDCYYEEEHQMNYGNKTYDKFKDPKFNYNMEFLTYDYDKSDKTYSGIEHEIFIIAYEIKKLMASGHVVFDKDLNASRALEYSDIAIILDRGSSFDLYKQIFTSLSIPIDVIYNEKMTNNTLLRIINSLYNAINYLNDYSKFSYYFVSLARSFLVEMSDEEILKASLTYYKETPLYELLKKSYYFASEHDSLTTFNYLLEAFQVYDKLSKVGGVDANLKVISYLSNLINSLAGIGYNTFDIANYLENSLDKEVTLAQANKGMKKGVQLLNIHQSKGLEYPICFFAGLTKGFNFSDLSSSFVFDAKFGIITPAFTDREIETIDKVIFKAINKKETISEKIRLFYVATTRAREKMYFVLPNYDLLTHKATVPALYKSFADFCDLYYDNFVSEYVRNVDSNKLVNKDYLEVENLNYKAELNDGEILSYDEKVFKPLPLMKSRISKTMLEYIDSDKTKLLDLGTHLHEIMQTLDLKHPLLSNLGLKKDEESILTKVLMLPCFKNLEACKVYQELEFYYDKDGKTYHGIIDLLIEHENFFEIIDYKLYNVDSEEYLKQLKAYGDYLRSISNKEIKAYLLSLLKQELTEVNLKEEK